jgi:hypothetical protein
VSEAGVKAVIDCAAYRGGVRVATLGIDEIPGALADPSLFIWLGLYEPGEALLERVQDAFQLHDLAVEDAHRAHQRPKLDRYGDSIFIVLRTAQFAGPAEELEFGETHLFVGPRYVVTVRHGSLKDHVGLRGRCEAIAIGWLGPGYVLYVARLRVDHYFRSSRSWSDSSKPSRPTSSTASAAARRQRISTTSAASSSRCGGRSRRCSTSCSASSASRGRRCRRACRSTSAMSTIT